MKNISFSVDEKESTNIFIRKHFYWELRKRENDMITTQVKI